MSKNVFLQISIWIQEFCADFKTFYPHPQCSRPIWPYISLMLNTLKVLKERYCLKLAIPQASSYASFEITILTKLGVIRL